MTKYRFKGRATGEDPQGYYFPNWSPSRITPVSVIAETKAEALTKALTMLGTHPRFGNTHYWGWAIKFDSIDEEPTS